MYGWFTALACLGSAAGAMAYAARVCHLSLFYTSNSIERLTSRTLTQSVLMNQQRGEQRKCAAAYYMMFPFELGFVMLAQLMVLHRISLP